MRIVCWQTIFMQFHTLFFSKIRKDVVKFIVSLQSWLTLKELTLCIGKTPKHSQDPDEMQQQFGPRSGTTNHWALYGSKLFDFDGISEGIFPKEWPWRKSADDNKSMQNNYQEGKGIQNSVNFLCKLHS